MHRWLLLFDVGSVFVFVVAGRSNHNGSDAALSILHTAGPFLIALGIGWLIARAWQDPISLRTGGMVAVVTVAGGVVLRRLVFDDGTAVSFVVVTTLFLTFLLLGWRLGARPFSGVRAPHPLN